MRKVMVMVLCVSLGACGWMSKKGKGTNIEPTDENSREKVDPNKRL